MSMTPAIACVLDSLSDVTSAVVAALAFGVLFLLLWGFERV
jgi:hypothetical protein